MLEVENSFEFLKVISKIKNDDLRERIKRSIKKIIENPESGKPMRHARKGTREIYLSSFRLSYVYFTKENKVIFLDFYHKDEQ